MTYPVSIMTLAQVRAELLTYRPHTTGTVNLDNEFLERRAALWRRLDWWIANVEKAA
jgi:hypothetical protein